VVLDEAQTAQLFQRTVDALFVYMAVKESPDLVSRQSIRGSVESVDDAAGGGVDRGVEEKGQVFAVVGLLEAMLDPVSVALANAPIDDEPVSEEEARDIAEARAAYARGEVVSNEEVLADFGLTERVRLLNRDRRVTGPVLSSAILFGSE
jgi:hypothetical protein